MRIAPQSKRLRQPKSIPNSGLLAGVDEAGRGPLAGPVVAAAVILDRDVVISGLKDSKLLTAQQRNKLLAGIVSKSLAWSVAWCDRAEIDQLNILRATLLAMRRAILGLAVMPQAVQVDGNHLPDLNFFGGTVFGQAIIGGDAKIDAISAASILAKVYRDRMMHQLGSLYPDYGFERHKGYGTAEHRAQLLRCGPCEQHRRSFKPVREALLVASG